MTEEQKAKRRVYHAKWHREKWAKDPEYRRRSAELHREWVLKNEDRAKELNRHHSLKRNCGGSLAEFNQKLEAQQGCCAICGEPAALQQDHCHATGKRRGLLCGDCNTALGRLKDSKDRLRSALLYLEDWENGE